MCNDTQHRHVVHHLLFTAYVMLSSPLTSDNSIRYFLSLFLLVTPYPFGKIRFMHDWKLSKSAPYFVCYILICLIQGCSLLLNLFKHTALI
jgi:hypothetical protein